MAKEVITAGELKGRTRQLRDVLDQVHELGDSVEIQRELIERLVGALEGSFGWDPATTGRSGKADCGIERTWSCLSKIDAGGGTSAS